MPDAAQPRPIPTQVQRSFLLWMLLVGLIVLNAALSVLSGQGLVPVLPPLLLAAAAGFGAYLMRAGRRMGRVVAGIAGGALVLLLLLVLVQTLRVVIGVWGAIVESGLQVSAIVQVAIPCVVIAVIVAATILMFRPPVNEYLA